MAERNIKLVLAYDGTDFCGWQIQKEQRTVQGELTRALEQMHKHPVTVTAAGRTDTGVHARGQVVNFLTDLDSIPGSRFRDAVNFYLPADISVLASREAPPEFNARFSARRRVYRYYTVISPVHLPHVCRYAARRRSYPDLRRLNRMAALLRGEQNFATFAAAGDSSRSKYRNVYSAQFYMEGRQLVFKIAADAFLYRMVRSLVGTILELHDNGRDRREFQSILEAGERKQAGTTAPARGLFLEKVYYGDEADFFA